MNEYLLAAEAATVAKRHPETIREAIRGGELHGTQRAKRGPWRIRRDCLDAWIEGEPCPHELKAAA